MTNMALNCPEMVKEFNKFIEDLMKSGKTDKDLDGNVQGNYQTNQERQKGYDEFNKQTNRSFGGQGTNNTGNQNSNNANPNRTGNSQTGMKGDGYAELPFKEGEDDTNRNTGSQNAGDRVVTGDGDWIDTKKTIRRNSNTVGISGNSIENQSQNEQYKNQAHNQIQNGNGGFKTAENEGDLIIPKLSLDTEIKNFENKLASVPENLKPGLLAKANTILNTETNRPVAARKLANLMKEFEANNKEAILNFKNLNASANSTLKNNNQNDSQKTESIKNLNQLKNEFLEILKNNCSRQTGADIRYFVKDFPNNNTIISVLYSFEGDILKTQIDWISDDQHTIQIKYMDIKTTNLTQDRYKMPLLLGNTTGHWSNTWLGSGQKNSGTYNYNNSPGIELACPNILTKYTELKKIHTEIVALNRK
jgi:hypothetical protein